MEVEIKPGDLALAVLTVPRLHLLAVRVCRVWVSCAGTVRCDIEASYENGHKLRPGTSFDRRQLIAIEALENLAPIGPVESADTKELAKAGAGKFA